MMKERIDENHSWVTDDDLNYTKIVLVFLGASVALTIAVTTKGLLPNVK